MKIYAHRGASSDFPEMSRAAYLGAVEQGADGFECDLRVTSDGVVVAWHDPDLKRIAGSPLVVSQTAYADLVRAYPILTLDEILDIAITHRKDLALETKHPVPSRGKIEYEIAKILATRNREILASGIEISLMSFSWLATRRAIRLGIPAVYLSTHWLMLRFVQGRSLGPSISSLRKYPVIVSYPHSRMPLARTFVWTVDEPEDAALCQRLGVDVLITNRPGEIRESLGRYRQND